MRCVLPSPVVPRTIGVVASPLSLVSLRVHAQDEQRTPSLASLVPDEQGAGLVASFFRSISARPQ